MRTIQHYLKTCDRKKVIDTFIYNHVYSSPITLLNMQDMTIREIQKYYKDELNALIDRLIKMKPVNNTEKFILFTSHTSTDENITHNLIKASELDGNENIGYGYKFAEFKEAIGFYVADTYLTQFYINDLLAEFLREITWTGFKQEGLEKTIQKIQTSLEECRKHKNDKEYFLSHEECIEKLKENLGCEFEEKDAAQEDAWHKLIHQQIQYDITCKHIELEKLRRMLCAEEKQK